MTNKELLEKIIKTDECFDNTLDDIRGDKIYAIHCIDAEYEEECCESLNFARKIKVNDKEYIIEFLFDTDCVNVCKNLRKFENVFALYDNVGFPIMHFSKDVYIEDGLVTDINMEDLEDLFKLNLREIELDFKFI